jgi:Flp pilus assembly protein TadB
MAQTRRKRQTKHRGNAAGVVESRGRTGRKPTAAEKSGDPREREREKEKLLDKRDRPPTWRGAFTKAMFAAIFLLLVVILVLHQSNQAISLFPIVLGLYTVVSYYTDKLVYDRRQRKKARQGGGGRAPSR